MDQLPADLPLSLSEQTKNGIHAALLRIHSKRLEKAGLTACLREVYDSYAAALRDASQPLGERLLTEAIPGWVFHWGVTNGWLPYPPMQQTQRARMNFLEGWRINAAYAPVPDHELNTVFGGYRITDWYKAEVMKHLESRIVFWRAEELTLPPALPLPDSELRETRVVQPSKHETVGEQINRLRNECNLTIEQLAEKIKVNARSVERHLAGDSVPYARNISAYERVFSKLLNRQVVIKKMP